MPMPTSCQSIKVAGCEFKSCPCGSAALVGVVSPWISDRVSFAYLLQLARAFAMRSWSCGRSAQMPARWTMATCSGIRSKSSRLSCGQKTKGFEKEARGFQVQSEVKLKEYEVSSLVH